MAEKQQSIVIFGLTPGAAAPSGAGFCASLRTISLYIREFACKGGFSVPAQEFSAGHLFRVSGETAGNYTLLEDALRANSRLVLSIMDHIVTHVCRFCAPGSVMRKLPSFCNVAVVRSLSFAGGLRL